MLQPYSDTSVAPMTTPPDYQVDPSALLRKADEVIAVQQRAQAAIGASSNPSTGYLAQTAPAAPQVPQRPSASADFSSGLTLPPGFAGQLVLYIYDSAPRPVLEVATVSALGLLAGVCGKVFNTYTKTGLNQYILLVARSATGKEAMHSGIANLMHAAVQGGNLGRAGEFVNFNKFASGQALKRVLADSPSFVNVIGEVGYTLEQMVSKASRPDSPMRSLRNELTDLYHKSGSTSRAGGIAYSDKDKNVQSITGAAYSLIGETTPHTFYELITPQIMADGFLSRFTVVEYEGERPPPNDTAPYFVEPWPDLLSRLQGLLAHALTLLHNGATQPVHPDAGARALLDTFNNECDQRVREAGDDESRRQMWNRAHLKALRIASLLAVADNWVQPVLTTAHSQWAIDLIRRDIATFSRRMENGDIGDGDAARVAKVLSIIDDYLKRDLPDSWKRFQVLKQVGIVPYEYLLNRTQHARGFKDHPLKSTSALKQTLNSLCDTGHLVHAPKGKGKVWEEYKFNGEAYIVNHTEGGPTATHWVDRALGKN
ncbi:DUF3987 domain-containing protein [Cupriavidus campinensis]